MAASGPLGDDELENVSGGIGPIEFGDLESMKYKGGIRVGQEYYPMKCPCLHATDFDILGFAFGYLVIVKCKKCGRLNEIDLSVNGKLIE